jgi:predicted metal-dependent phosphoesterase TrpH
VRIDLHIHSTASDGTLTPAEIVRQALALHLGAIAITDHDSVDGSREALEAGVPAPLGFLTGVEISASPPSSYPRRGSFHILGYRIDVADKALNRELKRLQRARENRNPGILNKLNALGIPIRMEEVMAVAGGGQVGRPHIAKLLISKGVADTIEDAFDRYLGNGKAAYVDKYRIDCATAIKRIKAAGGIAVLAHPGLLELNDERHLREILTELKQMGLGGIEVYYPEHSQQQTRRFTGLAQHFELLMTGGSDFHGTIHPAVKMGSGKGDLAVPYRLYEKLVRF